MQDDPVKVTNSDNGIIGSASASSGAKIVAVLATILQSPIDVDANIGGKS